MVSGHTFEVWADKNTIETMQLVILNKDGSEQIHDLSADENRYWRTTVADVPAGTDYMFQVNNDPELRYPDPRSRYQPQGVKGPSQIVDPGAFSWTDDGWQGNKLTDGSKAGLIYEAHIGTLTKEGTFESAIEKLDYLVGLGVTHIEVMPVFEFFGDRGWGYDGVLPFAPHHAYGGPEGLKAFINAAHEKGLAVILDVNYNHFGPEGPLIKWNHEEKKDEHQLANYVGSETGWGAAYNYAHDPVVDFALDNAHMLLTEFHADGLRLDAAHAYGPTHGPKVMRGLSTVSDKVEAETGIPRYVIAESDQNNPDYIRKIENGGYGLDAEWSSDELAHSVLTMFKGDMGGYREGYRGGRDVALAMVEGYIHDGTRWSPPRQKYHGAKMTDLSGHSLIGHVNTHDQTGNTSDGKRLHDDVGIERAMIAAAIAAVSGRPMMIFQGDEFAANKFAYFIGDASEYFTDCVRNGRMGEFEKQGWKRDEIADPADPKTFENSKVNWTLLDEGDHKRVYEFHKELLALRAIVPAMTDGSFEKTKAHFDPERQILTITRDKGFELIVNLGNEASIALTNDPDSIGAILMSNGPIRKLGGNLVVPHDSAAIVVQSRAIDGLPPVTVRPAEILVGHKLEQAAAPQSLAHHGLQQTLGNKATSLPTETYGI